MTRGKRAVIALCLVASAGVIALAVRTTNEKKTGGADGTGGVTSSASSAQANAAASAELRVRSPGLVREYDVEIEQQTRLAQDARKSGLTFSLRGRFGTAFVGLDGKRLRLRASLADGQLTVTPARDGLGSAAGELARPFYVTIEPDGSLASLQVSRETSHVARGLARLLVAATQVTVRDGSEWTARELDPTGRYEATYERRADGSILRRRARYVEVGGATKLEPVESVGKVTTGGKMEASVDAAGWLERMSASESVDVESGTLMPRLSATTRTRASLRGTHADPDALGAYERDSGELVDVPIAGGEADPAAARRADEELVGNAGLASLLDEARIGDADPKGRAALRRIEARIRLHDEDADAVARRAERSTVAEGRALSGALAGAGTDAATRANASILEGRKAPPEVRAQAASSLAFAEHAQADAARALTRGLTDPDADVRGASLLGLGAIARGMRESDPENAAGAIGELLRRYRAASNDEEREAALRALGNTGDPIIVPIVRDVLATGSESLRVVAAHALRFVTNAAADEVLAQAAVSDVADEVRAAAVSSIGFRDPARHEGVIVRTLGADDSVTVRIESARIAARGIGRVASFTPALRSAAQNDPSEDVRAIAGAAVGL